MAAKKIKSCKKSIGKRPKHDRQLGEFIRTVETVQAEADKRLGEIASICLNRECK